MNSTKGPSLAGREWLTGTFSVADILMADVLRLADRFDGPGGLSRLPRVRRARHGPASLRQGPRRPDCAFRRGGLSPGLRTDRRETAVRSRGGLHWVPSRFML
jgi:hypothetical protein